MARKSINDIEAQRMSILERLAEEEKNSTDPGRRAELYRRALRVGKKGDEYISNIEQSKGYKRHEARAEEEFHKRAFQQPNSYKYVLDNVDKHVDNIKSYKASRSTYMGNAST